MANDDWYKDPPGSKPPSQQPGFEGGFDDNVELPPEGQGWEALNPDPVLDRPVRDNQWGTAPPQNEEPQLAAAYGAPPQGFAPPGPQAQGPTPFQPNQQMMRPPSQAPMTSSNKVEVDDLIPVIVSVFLPGAGHLMLGQTKKGILLLLGILLCGVSYIISVIVALDAYMVGQARKHRHVDEMEFFPK